MFNESGTSGVFSFAEMNYLRLEAMDLFERCLTEGRPGFLETFVEQQISQEPPRLNLLREIAEDLHQRLLALRENHFDVRDRVLRTLRDDFKLDLSPMIPLHDLQSYHLLNLEDALGFLRAQQVSLTNQDETLLRQTLDSSLGMAAQLQRDVAMTENLYNYIMDWVMGLNATVARRYWEETRCNRTDDRIH